MNNDDSDRSESPAFLKLKSFTLEINKDLSKRLKNHIQILKQLDLEVQSKHAWAEKAIEEKLEKDSVHEHLEDEYLHFKLKSEIHEKVKNQVNIISKFRNSYSQKKWFLEAFYEKLNRDEQKIKQIMQNTLNSLSESGKK